MKDFVLNFDKMYFLVCYFIIWYIIVFVNDKFCYIVSVFFYIFELNELLY